eukprot:8463564-Pyramimonas_sp.AAC.1
MKPDPSTGSRTSVVYSYSPARDSTCAIFSMKSKPHLRGTRAGDSGPRDAGDAGPSRLELPVRLGVPHGDPAA